MQLVSGDLFARFPGLRFVIPHGGASWDDTKRYVDKAGRSEDDLRKIYELNARRVYPRLDPRLGPG